MVTSTMTEFSFTFSTTPVKPFLNSITFPILQSSTDPSPLKQISFPIKSILQYFHTNVKDKDVFVLFSLYALLTNGIFNN